MEGAPTPYIIDKINEKIENSIDFKLIYGNNNYILKIKSGKNN